MGQIEEANYLHTDKLLVDHGFYLIQFLQRLVNQEYEHWRNIYKIEYDRVKESIKKNGIKHIESKWALTGEFKEPFQCYLRKTKNLNNQIAKLTQLICRAEYENVGGFYYTYYSRSPKPLSEKLNYLGFEKRYIKLAKCHLCDKDLEGKPRFKVETIFSYHDICGKCAVSVYEGLKEQLEKYKARKSGG